MPSGADAEAILSHYLAGKKMVDDIDPAFLARVLGGNSCATLEEVANEAGLLAGYDRSETITQEHFMKAVLSTVHGIPEAVIDMSKMESAATQKCLYTAYHEAGHVVVSEIIDPGSTTLATVFRKRKSRFGGFVLSQHSDANLVKMQQAKILVSLGAKPRKSRSSASWTVERKAIWPMRLAMSKSLSKIRAVAGSTCIAMAMVLRKI